MDGYLVVETLEYGTTGFEPHNFAIKDGKDLGEKHYSIGADYAFPWLPGFENNTVRNFNNYTQLYGSNLVIYANELNMNLTMINNFNSTIEDQNEIDFIYFPPLRNQHNILLNLHNLGRSKF